MSTDGSQLMMLKKAGGDSPSADFPDAASSASTGKARELAAPAMLAAPAAASELAGLSLEELCGHVMVFAAENRLEDIQRDLVKGALVARAPGSYEQLEVLEEPDKAALRREAAHKWRHPLAMYMTIVLCSIGACVQGWDQTGCAGANLSFPREFGIPITDPANPAFQRNNWLVGIVNAAPFIGACMFSCWAADPVNHALGRRGTLFLAGLICLVCPLASAFTHTWWQLVLCRLVLGFGVGFKETSAPILAAESAPTAIRGALVMSWQMWTAFGIFLGYASNLVLYRIPRIAWRLQLGSAMVPVLPLLALVFCVPESPRWYMKRGRPRDAWKSLLRLRGARIIAARDLYMIYVQVAHEATARARHSYVKRFAELFYKARVRQATLASSVVMVAQQMCGINIIAFYSSSIFLQVHGEVAEAMWASFGFGLVNFVFAIPALFTIDTFGRRALLLFTFPLMFLALLGAGLSYLARDRQVRLALVALFVYVFTAFYSPGEGPVAMTYSAEVFPLSHREIGMAWAVAVNNFFAALLSLTFFRMEADMGVAGAFGFYACLNVVALGMIFLWVPETKQLSLEQLDEVFAIPTTQFVRYQLAEVIPWATERWLRGRRERLEPLVEFAARQRGGAGDKA